MTLRTERFVRAAAHMLLAVSLAWSAGAVAQVVVDKSEIRFTSKQMGVNVDGRFRKWKADVVFLPADLAKSSATFDIDIGSIDLASADSENEVRDKVWFDATKFPVAHFASTSIKDTGGGRFEIAGTLTMKGVAKAVVVPIAVSRDAAGNTAAEGAFTIKRLDFKLGEGEWADTATVANEVLVRFRLVLLSAK